MVALRKNDLDVSGFDYLQLDTETRIVVQQRTGEIREILRKTAQDIIDIGRKLIEVKDRLEHGQFLNWLDVEFQWSDQTARNFMNVSEQFGQNQNYFEFAPTVLYMLSQPSTPEPARTRAVALAKQGQHVGVKEAKALIAQSKPAVVNPPPKPAPTYHNLKDVDPFPEDERPPIQVDEIEQPTETPTRPSSLPPSVGHPLPANGSHAINPAGAYIGTVPVHPRPVEPDQRPIIKKAGQGPYSFIRVGDNNTLFDVVDARKCYQFRFEGSIEMLMTVLAAMNAPKATVAPPAPAVEVEPQPLTVSLCTRWRLNPEDVSDYINARSAKVKSDKKLFREKLLTRISYALNFILVSEFEPPAEYNRIDLLDMLLTSTESVKAAKKPARKANQPERTEEENKSIVAIIEAYLDTSKALTKNMYARENYRSDALAMWNAGIRPEHIVWFGDDPFWKGKKLKWETVRDGIIRWLDEHHPGWNAVVVPAPAADSDDNINPEFLRVSQLYAGMNQAGGH